MIGLWSLLQKQFAFLQFAGTVQPLSLLKNTRMRENNACFSWLAWLAPGYPSSASDPDQVAWADVVAASLAHDVAGTLYACLRKRGLLHTVPVGELKTLEQAYGQAKLSSMAWQRALRIVLPALVNGGIRTVPFKGAALAFLCYEDAAMRSMADIDLWIDSSDMATACTALERLGLEARSKPTRPLEQQENYDGEIQFTGKTIGIRLVELHWGVFAGEWLARTAAVDRASISQRLMPTTLLGAEIQTLAPEDHLIQVAVHASINHTFCSGAVRSLLDLVVIAEKGVDWSAVIQRCGEWRLATVMGHTLALAGEMYQNSPMLEASAKLISPWRLRVLRAFANPRSVLQKRPLDRSLLKWVYLLCAVDRPRDALHLVTSSLWPDAAWLRARYGGNTWKIRCKHLFGAAQGHF